MQSQVGRKGKLNQKLDKQQIGGIVLLGTTYPMSVCSW